MMLLLTAAPFPGFPVPTRVIEAGQAGDFPMPRALKLAGCVQAPTFPSLRGATAAFRPSGSAEDESLTEFDEPRVTPAFRHLPSPEGVEPMSKNATMSCPDGTPIRLPDLAVSAARAVGSQHFHLCATVDTPPPTSTAGSVILPPWSVLTADLARVDPFPGVGASVYLWAWPLSGVVDVSVSRV